MRGPWQYGVQGRTRGGVHYAITPEGSSGWKDDEYMSVSGICSEDDARKMAAAPTMLTAIEQFEAWWQEVGQVSFNGAPACVFALREAAAKARGES